MESCSSVLATDTLFGSLWHLRYNVESCSVQLATDTLVVFGARGTMWSHVLYNWPLIQCLVVWC